MTNIARIGFGATRESEVSIAVPVMLAGALIGEWEVEFESGGGVGFGLFDGGLAEIELRGLGKLVAGKEESGCEGEGQSEEAVSALDLEFEA